MKARITIFAALAAAVLMAAPAALAHGRGAAPQQGPPGGTGVSTTVEGTLLVAHSDDFKARSASWRYMLRTAGGTQPLTVKHGSISARPGARVRVDAVSTADGLVAESGGAVVQTGGAVAEASSTGARKTAVLLINFTADTRQPFTADQVRDAFFTGAGSVNAYYKDESWNQTSFVGKTRADGDVYGWFTLNTTTSGCNWQNWGTLAQQAATASGVSLSGYQHIVYIFPQQQSCGWAGLAYVPGTESWINGTLSARVIGHEIGHNVGAHHASSLSCTSGSTRVSIAATGCTASEYGDPADIMGSALRQTSNFHKGQYTWFPLGNMRTVTASGTFTIEPLEAVTTGIQLVRIPRGTSVQCTDGSVSLPCYYYLEFRQPTGAFDNFSASDPWVNGVGIRMATDYGQIMQTKLIDATPATTTFNDAPLPVGATFTDSTYNISVKTNSVSPFGASVTVTVNGSPPPPTDFQPPTKVGALTATAQGTSVALQWGPATDDVGVTGYKVYRDGVQIGTATGTSFTDATGAPSTTYSYTVAAFDAAGNTGMQSDPAVATTGEGDTTAPSDPANLQQTGRTTSSVTITWDPSTDDTGVTGYGVYRNGTKLGNVTTAGVQVTGLTCGGSWTFGIDAFDAAGNHSNASTIVATTSACADYTRPSTPTGLRATAQAGPQVSLTWTASTDNIGVAGYRVYRAGVQIGTSATPAYVDVTVASGKSYGYTVKAYDAAGNLSYSSATVYVTTPSSSDTTAPSAPTGLTATASTGQVALAWTASTDNVAVTGYRIYRGGAQVGTSATTDYTDTTVAAGTTYSYTVRAVDAAGNLSTASLAASATTPGGGGGGGGADTTPPSSPTGLAVASRSRTSITLTWLAAGDNIGVTAYGMYRGNLRLTSTTGLRYTFMSLTCGTTYTLRVDAVDAAGNRSGLTSISAATAAC